MSFESFRFDDTSRVMVRTYEGKVRLTVEDQYGRPAYIDLKHNEARRLGEVLGEAGLEILHGLVGR